MSSRVEWNGREVLQNVSRAAMKGIDKTLADCTREAKRNHTFTNRSTILEGSIRAEPSRQEGRRIVGKWGSFEVEYALYVEVGTATSAPYPYLRPAADLNYPELAANIAQFMEGG